MKRIGFIAVIMLVFGVQLLSAQAVLTASFRFMQETIRIGEPLSLVLSVRTGTEQSVIFPDLPEQWGDFTVTAIGEPEVLVGDGDVFHELPITVVPWRTGSVLTPEWVVYYTSPDTADQRPLFVLPAEIVVDSVLDTNPTLRPRKSTINMPVATTLLNLLISFAIGFFIAAILYLMRKRITGAVSRVRQPKAVRPETISTQTTTSLQRIGKEQADPARQTVAVATTLRDYLRDRFELGTTEMTTTETITYLEDQNVISKPRLEELAFMLKHADLVKFSPTEAPTGKSMVDIARRWVMETEAEIEG